jgi:hypothetical protein
MACTRPEIPKLCASPRVEREEVSFWITSEYQIAGSS